MLEIVWRIEIGGDGWVAHIDDFEVLAVVADQGFRSAIAFELSELSEKGDGENHGVAAFSVVGGCDYFFCEVIVERAGDSLHGCGYDAGKVAEAESNPLEIGVLDSVDSTGD